MSESNKLNTEEIVKQNVFSTSFIIFPFCLSVLASDASGSNNVEIADKNDAGKNISGNAIPFKYPHL